MIACLLLLFARIFFIQIVAHDRYSERAKDQHTLILTLKPKRGAIFDRNLKPFALSLKSDSIYAIARDVRNKPEAAEALSEILDKDKRFIL